MNALIASMLLAAVTPLVTTENEASGSSKVVTNAVEVLASKADKPAGSDVDGMIAALDEDGNLVAGPVAATNVADKESVALNEDRIMLLYELHTGTNGVAVCITNYQSGSYSPAYAKLVIREVRGGAETEIYNSHVDITNHIHAAIYDPTNGVDTKIERFYSVLEEEKADKAWQKYCSDGTPSPSNMVVISTPSTVFSAGYAWTRVATASGSCCVLSAENAPASVSSDNYATFRFTHDLTGSYFGYVLNGYTEIGVNATNIVVDASGDAVTLEYDVIMTGYPIIYRRPDLEGDASDPSTWEQLCYRTGAPVPGASRVVTWLTAPGEVPMRCAISGISGDPRNFFRASAGGGLGDVPSLFETNMPVDAKAGIVAAEDGALGVVHIIRPVVVIGEEGGHITTNVEWRVQ